MIRGIRNPFVTCPSDISLYFYLISSSTQQNKLWLHGVCFFFGSWHRFSWFSSRLMHHSSVFRAGSSSLLYLCFYLLLRLCIPLLQWSNTYSGFKYFICSQWLSNYVTVSTFATIIQGWISPSLFDISHRWMLYRNLKLNRMSIIF